MSPAPEKKPYHTPVLTRPFQRNVVARVSGDEKRAVLRCGHVKLLPAGETLTDCGECAQAALRAART